MKEVKIFLFRHAESYDNANDYFSGRRDYGLSEQGRKDAKKLRDELEDKKIELIVTSPMKRCLETIDIAFPEKEKTQVIHDGDLVERAYGIFQGKKHDELPWYLELVKRLTYRSYFFPPPGGESFRTVWKRVTPAIKRIELLVKEEKKNVAICAHHNSMRPIRAHFERKSTAYMLLHNSKPGEVFEYTIKV